jgi:hypothetical protein
MENQIECVKCNSYKVRSFNRERYFVMSGIGALISMVLYFILHIMTYSSDILYQAVILLIGCIFILMALLSIIYFVIALCKYSTSYKCKSCGYKFKENSN